MTDEDQRAAMPARDIDAHLSVALSDVCAKLDCDSITGLLVGLAGFVLTLESFDAKATSEFLRAMADIANPDLHEDMREKAEKRREKYAEQIFKAAILAGAKPEGSA